MGTRRAKCHYRKSFGEGCYSGRGGFPGGVRQCSGKRCTQSIRPFRGASKRREEIEVVSSDVHRQPRRHQRKEGRRRWHRRQGLLQNWQVGQREDPASRRSRAPSLRSARMETRLSKGEDELGQAKDRAIPVSTVANHGLCHLCTPSARRRGHQRASVIRARSLLHTCPFGHGPKRSPWYGVVPPALRGR